MNALEVENVCKSYQAVRTLPGGNGGRAPGSVLARLFLGETFGQRGRRAVTPVTALDGVSLTVEPGQAVGLYGRNGSGKTTLLSILGGVFGQDSGSVRCFGYDTRTHRRQVQRHVVPVFGWLDGITWAFTGRQNVEKLLVMHHVEPARYAQEIDTLARDVGLHDRLDDRAARYSQGMRIKLQLIAALLLQRACAPCLLLLDEPFLGLDVFTQGTLRSFLRQSRQRGDLSILLATHQAADIEAICDRVVVLDEGRIVARGPVEELRRRSGTETVRVEYVPPDGQPLPDAVFLQAGALACESRVRDGRAEAVLLIEDGRAAPARFAAALQEAGCSVTSLRVRETSFEDVLARLIEEGAR